MNRSLKSPIYSEKCTDNTYEYRQVTLPHENTEKNAKTATHLYSEEEWRALGVSQSRGWEHYAYHE